MKKRWFPRVEWGDQNRYNCDFQFLFLKLYTLRDSAEATWWPRPLNLVALFSEAGGSVPEVSWKCFEGVLEALCRVPGGAAGTLGLSWGVLEGSWERPLGALEWSCGVPWRSAGSWGVPGALGSILGDNWGGPGTSFSTFLGGEFALGISKYWWFWFWMVFDRFDGS